MTSDVFATAWEGLTWSGFEAGDSVAVFGAGPVGQMAAYSAVLRGASRVYIIDRIESRLTLAQTIGAIPINYVNTSAAQQIMALEPQGVDRAVDAVGMEARAANGSYDQNLAVQEAFNVVRSGGGIGIVGVYATSNDAPGHPHSTMLPSMFPFALSDAFMKTFRFQIGIADARPSAPQLIDLISSGEASPGYIVSSQINITQAPEYYQRFNNWLESKVVIRF
jgi:threonine dehydrogenase-like Zn-dependent dehydrogenase